LLKTWSTSSAVNGEEKQLFSSLYSSYYGHKKTRSANAKAGFKNCHALAVFLERPQAENQIGAELVLYQKSLSNNIYK